MLPSADYPSFSSARVHLKEVLDRADRGQIVTIARGHEKSAVLSADKLRELLTQTVRPQIQVAHEDDRIIVFMESRPFVSEGLTVDDALDDLIESLREYAEDWVEHLSGAPNHAGNWALVELVTLSSDQQLRDWFERDGE